MRLLIHRAAVLLPIAALTLVVVLGFLPFVVALSIGARSPITFGEALAALSDPWVFLWPRAGEA